MVAEPGLDVQEGTDLNLSCHLPGGPEPRANSTFSWLWNGRQLHKGPLPTLGFSRVARGQAGMYQCRAEHPAGTTTSAAVLLRVRCEYATQMGCDLEYSVALSWQLARLQITAASTLLFGHDLKT